MAVQRPHLPPRAIGDRRIGKEGPDHVIHGPLALLYAGVHGPQEEANAIAAKSVVQNAKERKDGEVRAMLPCLLAEENREYSQRHGLGGILGPVASVERERRERAVHPFPFMAPSVKRPQYALPIELLVGVGPSTPKRPQKRLSNAPFTSSLEQGIQYFERGAAAGRICVKIHKGPQVHLRVQLVRRRGLSQPRGGRQTDNESSASLGRVHSSA